MTQAGREAIILNIKDNTGTALKDLKAGAALNIAVEDKQYRIVLREDVPYGFKFALCKILKGEAVIKYGETIGRATIEINEGSIVHEHNMEGLRGRGVLQPTSKEDMSMKHKFLVHGYEDNVGVAVQDINTGENVIGVFLDTNDETTIQSNHDIPLGHKIALKPIKTGEYVFEYGETIGKAVQDINPGDLVHVHNIKSVRW
ncbi:Altronate dehydratase [Desulfotomaculum arcticum]|uniref:Altronate dehydratase n=1 Tax=Desulfotruncus arcticus DSM 17038 TaxID=1121424 RepID=A0A1I2WTD8_9FIRM|nr:UxaA family hydrolase [Desulfotruncus arcticus]SFH02861.1 Altronate dehydratase [Desulfotomaculum arcticum] [Desulfotruncus arcticus DSM 17038]